MRRRTGPLSWPSWLVRFLHVAETLDVNDLYDRDSFNELTRRVQRVPREFGPAPAPPSPRPQRLIGSSGGEVTLVSKRTGSHLCQYGGGRLHWPFVASAIGASTTCSSGGTLWVVEYKAPRAPSTGLLVPDALAMIAAINAATPEVEHLNPSTLQRDIAEAIPMSQGASGTPGLSPNTLAAIAAFDAAHAPSEFHYPGVASSPRHGTLPLPGSPRRSHLNSPHHELYLFPPAHPATISPYPAYPGALHLLPLRSVHSGARV